MLIRLGDPFDIKGCGCSAYGGTERHSEAFALSVRCHAAGVGQLCRHRPSRRGTKFEASMTWATVLPRGVEMLNRAIENVVVVRIKECQIVEVPVLIELQLIDEVRDRQLGVALLRAL